MKYMKLTEDQKRKATLIRYATVLVCAIIYAVGEKTKEWLGRWDYFIYVVIAFLAFLFFILFVVVNVRNYIKVKRKKRKAMNE